MPCTDNESLLREDGILHGTGVVRGRFLSRLDHYLVMLLNGAQLTVLGMKHPEENVALQAVEFWSTVCEEEIELAIEAAEVRKSQSPRAWAY